MVDDVYMAPERAILAATVGAEVDLRAVVVDDPAPAGNEVAGSRNEVGIGGSGNERARERERYCHQGLDHSTHCGTSRETLHGVTSRLSRIRRPHRSSHRAMSRAGR